MKALLLIGALLLAGCNTVCNAEGCHKAYSFTCETPGQCQQCSAVCADRGMTALSDSAEMKVDITKIEELPNGSFDVKAGRPIYTCKCEEIE